MYSNPFQAYYIKPDERINKSANDLNTENLQIKEQLDLFNSWVF